MNCIMFTSTTRAIPGATDETGTAWATHILNRLQEHYPDIDIRVSENNVLAEPKLFVDFKMGTEDHADVMAFVDGVVAAGLPA